MTAEVFVPADTRNYIRSRIVDKSSITKGDIFEAPKFSPETSSPIISLEEFRARNGNQQEEKLLEKLVAGDNIAVEKLRPDFDNMNREINPKTKQLAYDIEWLSRPDNRIEFINYPGSEAFKRIRKTVHSMEQGEIWNFIYKIRGRRETAENQAKARGEENNKSLYLVNWDTFGSKEVSFNQFPPAILYRALLEKEAAAIKQTEQNTNKLNAAA